MAAAAGNKTAGLTFNNAKSGQLIKNISECVVYIANLLFLEFLGLSDNF